LSKNFDLYLNHKPDQIKNKEKQTLLAQAFAELLEESVRPKK